MSPTDPATAPHVTFYWRPGCMFCWTLRRNLERAGVALDEHNIWKDRDAAAFVRSVAKGNETVPTVVVAGEALVNPSVEQVVHRLNGSARPTASERRPGLVRRLFAGRRFLKS